MREKNEYQLLIDTNLLARICNKLLWLLLWPVVIAMCVMEIKRPMGHIRIEWFIQKWLNRKCWMYRNLYWKFRKFPPDNE